MSEEDQRQGGQTVNRRGYLGSIAGGVASLSLIGSAAVGTAAAYPDYDEVVDLVEVGADPSGEESVVPLLDEYAADDTLLVFPPGEYLMTEQFRFTGYTNFGIVGNDATIVPGTVEAMDGKNAVEGTFHGPTRLFRLGVIYAPGDYLLFEGLDFDFTRTYSGFRAIEAYVEHEMLVRDIDIIGQHDIASYGPALFSVTDPDGISTVEGFRAPDGGEFSENTIGSIAPGPTGMLVAPSHKGKLWFIDCELGSFPDNGLYASSTDGRVVVKGGVYKNSNVSNIRLMADHSYIHDATVIVDNALGRHNQPGIRLDSGYALWVHNTDVILSDPDGDAIIVQNDVDFARVQDSSITVGEGRVNHAVDISSNANVVDVFDTDIQFDGTGSAINISGDNDASDGEVKLLRTAITGSGPGLTCRSAILVDRKNVEIRESTIRMDGDHYRRGIDILGDDCNVDGCLIKSTHYPIVNAANGTRLDDLTLRSYEDYEGLKLDDSYSDVTVTESTIYNGYIDQGTSNLTMRNNVFPDS